MGKYYHRMLCSMMLAGFSIFGTNQKIASALEEKIVKIMIHSKLQKPIFKKETKEKEGFLDE